MDGRHKMTAYTWTGFNRDAGGNISDMEHIRQSVRDILTTPKGTRLMRRDYGSDLANLIDGPLTPGLRLQVISATYSALLQWEPRLSVSAIEVSEETHGITLTLHGHRRDTLSPITLHTSVNRTSA